MAGIVESVLIQISAAVSGAAGVAGLSGGIGALSGKLLGLNAGLQIMQQVTQAVGGMVSQMEEWANAANKAATDTKVFALTVGRFGVSIDEANGAAERLAAKFGLSVEEVKGSMTDLIRAGFRDMGQLEKVMTGAAASAIAFGRTASEGFDRVGDAAVTGLSAALNSIGVSQNLGPALDKYAGSLDKTADSLTDVEKAQTLANLVLEATGTEVEALGEIQNDYVQAQQQADLAQKAFSKTMGEITMPIVTRYKLATADLTNSVIEGIKAYRDGGDAVAVLSKKYPQLGQALSILKPIMDALGRAGREVFAALADSARNLMPVVESLRPLFERVWNAIPGIIEKAGRVISEVFHAINDLWTNVLKPVWDSLQPALGAAVDGIIKNLNDMLDYMDGMVTTVRALINGDWKGAWTTFSEAVGKAYASVRENLQKIDEVYQEWEKNAIASVFESAKNIGLNIKDGIIAGISDLSVQLSEKVEGAITAMTDRLPQWVKDRMGLDGLKDALDGAQNGAVDNANAARERITGRGPQGIDTSKLNDFQTSVLTQALQQRGDRLADSVVDYCARWVRDTLGDAAPEMRAQIDKLFQSNPEIYTNAAGKVTKTPTARSAYANFDKAGLAKDYKTFADLRPGDTVFYVDGNENHTGVYIGNQMVRGNNRVTYKQSGGTNPVGEVNINALGKVTAYVPATDLIAYLKGATPVTGQPKAGTTANTQTTGATQPPPPDTVESDVYTAKQYAQAMNLIKAIEAAKKASQAKPGDFGLAQILTAAEQASEKFTKATKAQEAAMKAANAAGGGSKGKDGYVTTAENIVTYGEKALQLIKAVEVAEKTGNTTTRTLAQNRLDTFVKLGDAQAGVVQAERAAYASRQQLGDKEKQDQEARAALTVQIARDAAAGREADARAGLESLKRSQQAKLDAAEGDAARTAQIVASTGPQILAAEAGINRRVREQAVKAAQDTATERLKVAGANAGQIEAQRKADAVRAYQAERTANSVARSEQAVAEKGANKTAAEEEKRLASELAGLKVDSAKATSGRLKTIAEADLARLGDDANARLSLIKKTSQAEYDRAQAIALATRKLAYQDAAGKPNGAALRDKAQAEYLATLETARISRLGQVKTAQDAVSKSLEDGVKAGNAALDSLEKLNLGGLDLVATAQKLPETRAQFDTLYARIVALRGELAEPGVVDAWTQSITDMGKAGQLSAVQVGALLDIIKDLGGARDTQLPDNLQGRGVVKEAAVGDAAQGVLAPGEAERLAADMIGMDPEELGRILAGLVAQGFGDSELGELIRAQLAGSDFSDLALMVSGPGGLRFQTDAELRGIGQAGTDTTAAYLNLESVIQDIGQFSLPELQALASATELNTDQVNNLYAAWEAVYGQFEKGAGSDATAGPGKGLVNNVRPDDASRGVLASGEADTLLTAMIGMDPEELGGVLADLVAKGFGDSDLGKLIQEYIAGLNFDELALKVTDVTTGESRFQTDDELAGKTEKVKETQAAFLDLEGVLQNVATLGRDALGTLLLDVGKLGVELSPVTTDLYSVFGRLSTGAQTAGEARVELAGLRTQLEGIGGPAAASLIGVIDETVRGFDDLGSVSADVTSALSKLRGEVELPYTGLIRKLQQMRTEPGAATAEIDTLILSLQKLNGNAARTQGVEKMTAKMNEFADYARKSIPLVASAFQALGGASDEVASAWGDSLGRMVDDVANFAGAIVRGDYLGAAIQGLTSIFTFFARRAQEARAEMKATADYNKGFKFDADGYGTRKTTSTTTGFLFWKKTVVTEQIDEAGKQMALTFENAVTGGVGGGLAAAVASNDSSILEKSIFTKMKDAALGGLTEAFFTSGTVVAVVGPLVQKLITAFKSGNTENIRSAVAEFRDGVKGLRSEMDGLVEAGKIVTDELGGAGDSFASSFSDSIRNGVRAMLGGQSPLQALYDDVRAKIENAVVNGFFVQAALDKLQPFLDALKAKLDAGMDPTQAIAQIGQQLPGISAQLQLEMGPLVAALNTYLPNALNANTAALNGNTAALNASKFEQTTVVSYASVGRPSDLRQQLAGL